MSAKPTHSDESLLAEMNAEFCVVSVAGNTRVLVLRDSIVHAGGKTPVYMTFNDFKHLYDRRRAVLLVSDGTGNLVADTVLVGSWWLKQRGRRQYDGGYVFVPGDMRSEIPRKNGDVTLNSWTGFAFEPSAEGSCELYLDHLRCNVCVDGRGEPVPAYYEYLLNWMANAVQHRDRPGHTAVCLRGDEGSGKGFAAKSFGHLFGQHFLQIANPEHLTGKFNAHLETVLVLFADEAFYAGDRRHEQILKTLVTEETFVVEHKGLNARQVRNYLHIFLASNNDWIVPAGPTARRWFVLDVANHRRRDSAYFAAIQKQLDEGGYAKLLHMLLARDVSNFRAQGVPATEALQRQKNLSRRGIDSLIETICADGIVPCQPNGHANVALSSGTDAMKARRLGTSRVPVLIEWAREQFPDLRRVTPEVLGMELREKWRCERWNSNHRRGYVFPPLADLRAMFDKRHGPRDWPPQDDWEFEEGNEPVGRVPANARVARRAAGRGLTLLDGGHDD